MIKVKICGITNQDDAQAASRLGADALGFIFAKKSPRYIKPLTAKKIIRSLDPFIVTVGVFVDESKENVLSIASELNLDCLQFHGNESPSYCNFFKKKFKVIDHDTKTGETLVEIDGEQFKLGCSYLDGDWDKVCNKTGLGCGQISKEIDKQVGPIQLDLNDFNNITIL